MLRRRVLSAALLVMLSGCAWAQYRGDAAHTGHQPFEYTIGIADVPQLVDAWTTGDVYGSGVVARGVLYAPGPGGLQALDAAGVNGCGGTPRICSPLWTGSVPPGTSTVSTPAVADGIVYVTAGNTTLLAFDAAGANGCGGAPRKCSPLWSAPLAVGSYFMSPTVADGKVYLGSTDGTLYAFDGAGVDRCSGVPKTCAPLWTGSLPNGSTGTPSVANGIVYIGGSYQVAAFDAAGLSGCSGVPKVCTPLWTAAAPDRAWTLAVVDGVLYASGFGTASAGELDAFDAAGVEGCSGVPKTCTPLWTAVTDELLGNPAVATQTVFASSLQGTLYAFDANGVTGCSGSPTTCDPKWVGDLGASSGWAATVANGVVYVPSFNALVAFDASGTGCPGSPGVCDPLWVSPQFDAGLVDPIVVNGTVFVSSQDGTIHALRLPAA